MNSSNAKFVKLCYDIIALENTFIKALWNARRSVEQRRAIELSIKDIKNQRRYISLTTRNKFNVA